MTDDVVVRLVSFDRTEGGIAHFHLLETKGDDDPVLRSSVDQPWCPEENLPEDAVAEAVFEAEIETPRNQVQGLDYRPEKTKEWKLAIAAEMADAEKEALKMDPEQHPWVKDQDKE